MAYRGRMNPSKLWNMKQIKIQTFHNFGKNLFIVEMLQGAIKPGEIHRHSFRRLGDVEERRQQLHADLSNKKSQNDL